MSQNLREDTFALEHHSLKRKAVKYLFFFLFITGWRKRRLCCWLKAGSRNNIRLITLIHLSTTDPGRLKATVVWLVTPRRTGKVRGGGGGLTLGVSGTKEGGGLDSRGASRIPNVFMRIRESGLGRLKSYRSANGRKTGVRGEGWLGLAPGTGWLLQD